MKKIILSSAATIIFIISCNKDAEKMPAADNALIAKVNSWLDNQKPANKPNKSANVTSLEHSLDHSALRFEDYNNGQKILSIPIKDNFKTIHNLEKNSNNNLVLIIDKSGNIKKGNIVMY